ncbi:MAG TPA: hypothetical protein VHV81_02170 [Steroidobacteraceae bacterium]|nr:hypothetical protein [Steroidobacteraceae bacterium]
MRATTNETAVTMNRNDAAASGPMNADMRAERSAARAASRGALAQATRAALGVAAAALLGGCHLLHGFEPNCHKPQEYQRAGEVAPLIVPAGLDNPNTKESLVVPKADAASAPPPGPKDACLDVPPKYKPAPTNKAGTQTSSSS